MVDHSSLHDYLHVTHHDLHKPLINGPNNTVPVLAIGAGEMGEIVARQSTNKTVGA